MKLLIRIRILVLFAALLASPLLHADAGSNNPQFCNAQTRKCTSCHGNIANGCILLSLELGETTPWSGSMPVFLKVRTSEASPSLSTTSRLKLVLGYTFMHLGPETLGGGRENDVTFSDEAGRSIEFRFESGSSVGVPRFVMGGDARARLQMVDAEGWATLSDPAFFELYPGDGSVWRYVASPATTDFGALARYVNPRGAAYSWDDMGVAVLRDASGFLRQVATRTRLADIVVHSATHYTVTVYPLTEDPQTDPDTGLLSLPPHDPVRVLDVRRGTTDRELIVGYRKGTGDMRTYRYVAKNGDWELTNPSGLIDANELYFADDETGARRIHVWKDSDGTALRRMEANFVDKPWGWAMTNYVEGIPGDATRTTSWSYFESGSHRGFVQEQITPTGNRILYEYDDKNRVVRESMPLVEEETLYSYEPVDPSDSPLLCDTRPRCVVRKMQGVEIQRTYYVYGTNGVDVVERVGEQGAAYGGTNVLRTVTTYYPVTGAITDGLVQSVRHEDGTIDNYAYDLANGIWTETVTHVHELAPDIVPMRTTRSVRVYNALGQLVDSRTDLCTIGVEDLVPQADWTPIERLQYAYDVDGNEIRREDLAGRLWTAEWAGNCCGKVSETDWQGITTTYAYDAEGRVVAKQAGSVLTETAYDVLGRVTNVSRRGIATADRPAATVLPSSFVYDSLGRLLAREGENGIRRVYAYVYRPEGGEIRTVVEAPGTDCERVTATVIDPAGRTNRELRNGTLRRTIVYAPLLETVYEGSRGTNSPAWREMRFDRFDRLAETHKPGFSGAVLHSSNAFDEFGNTVEIEDGYTSAAPDSAPVVTSRRLSTFNEFGDLAISAEDVNRNGQIDLAESDVVVSNSVNYVIRDGFLWQESARFAFPDTNSAELLRVFTSRVRLTNLGTTETTELGAANIVTDTQTVDAFGNIASQRSFVDRSSSRFATFNDSAFSALSAWDLSVGNHSVSNRTATGILSSRKYDALDRVIAQTDGRGNTITLAYDARDHLVATTDATGATTAYGYDALGRRISETNALGLVTTTAYDLDGNVVSQRGAQYPVDYAYDDYGRMAAMSTYRNEDLSHADVTTWLYDEATGLMTNKVYADGKGPTYDYTPDGKLARRTWARGVTTDYGYDSQGRLVSKTYSDSTPDVSLSYDRLGHTLSAICAGVSTNLYAYNRLGQLTNEVQNGTTIARTYDALGRATGYAIGDGVVAGSAVAYSYDTLGRFASVSSGTNVFSYSYLPGSDLVSGMAANTGHAWERIYEPDRDLIATVHNRYGDRTISRFDYTNDEIGRRIARVDSGEAFAETAFERYGYNDRSELISAQRFHGANIDDLTVPVPNRSWSYGYNSIGNRVFSAEDQNGQTVITSYEANELNQHTKTSSAHSTTVFEYDDDGNMISDGRFLYSWNGENRMVRAEEIHLSTNQTTNNIDYSHDEMGRLISETFTGATNLFRSFIWDGHNPILTGENGKNSHAVWGLDLDGQLQGSGGIGGLLALVDGTEAFGCMTDANGNLTDFVLFGSQQSFHFEYTPFGETFDFKDRFFPFLFSTKPLCHTTGFLLYQYRTYFPKLGFWSSRDLIGELDSLNLYSFCGNSPNNKVDYLGFDSSQTIMGGELHRGDGRHESYLIFKLTCPECEKVKVTSIRIRGKIDVAKCIANIMFPDDPPGNQKNAKKRKDFVDDWMKKNLSDLKGAGWTDESSIQTNCDGTPVEVWATMRTRFAGAKKGKPEFADCYKNNLGIYFECEKCPEEEQ